MRLSAPAWRYTRVKGVRAREPEVRARSMSDFRQPPDLPVPDAWTMHNDTERCVRAVRSKDARFDGWFFTAVLTTRIYCRPSCPVVPPKAANMTFYPSAAACQQAGFRACKRCRP